MKGLTKKELATLSGYTYRRLYDIDRDLPADKKLFILGDDGKYDVALFVQHWVDYRVNCETEKADDLDAVRAQHEVVKTEKTRLEVERMSGRLVAVSDIKRLWGNIANTVMQNLIHLPHKVAPLLTMIENPEEISGLLEDEIRKVLEEMAVAPLPEDIEGAEDDGEAEEQDG